MPVTRLVTQDDARVLAKLLRVKRFVRFGVAPAYLNIAGQWQDHALYQIVNQS